MAGVVIDCLIDSISDKISKKLFVYVDERLTDIPSNVWDEGPVVRGDTIDKAEALKNNLGHNFPTIDRLSDGVAASTKSYDITSNTYSNGSGWWYRLKKDIDKLDQFTEAFFNGKSVGLDEYSSKCLNIVLPNVELSEAQKVILQKAKDYAKKLGIQIKVFITN